MGRFSRSVIGVVGLLACLLHHAYPLVVIPNTPVYNMPSAVMSGLEFASGYPMGGKSHVSTSSSNIGGVSYPTRIMSPSVIVGRSLVGYRQNPQVYTVGSRRPMMRRGRINYTSVPAAGAFTLLGRNFRPNIAQQPTRHFVRTNAIATQGRTPTIPFGRRRNVPFIGPRQRPVRTRISSQTIGNQIAPSFIGRDIPSFIRPVQPFRPGSVEQRSIGQTPIRQVLVGQTPIGQTPIRQVSVGQKPNRQTSIRQVLVEQTPIRQVSVGQKPIRQTSIRQVSSGSSRVAISPRKGNYVKKTTVQPKITRRPSIKKYKKSSKTRTSRRRKSKKSSKSKAKRKAELRAKLKALRAKRKYKKSNTVV